MPATKLFAMRPCIDENADSEVKFVASDIGNEVGGFFRAGFDEVSLGEGAFHHPRPLMCIDEG